MSAHGDDPVGAQLRGRDDAAQPDGAVAHHGHRHPGCDLRRSPRQNQPVPTRRAASRLGISSALGVSGDKGAVGPGHPHHFGLAANQRLNIADRRSEIRCGSWGRCHRRRRTTDDEVTRFDGCDIGTGRPRPPAVLVPEGRQASSAVGLMPR